MNETRVRKDFLLRQDPVDKICVNETSRYLPKIVQIAQKLQGLTSTSQDISRILAQRFGTAKLCSYAKIRVCLLTT